MPFLRVWLAGICRPARFAHQLADKPAPQWGLYGQLVRAVLLSLLMYLPLQLMGRVPPTPSNLSCIPTENYYGALIWISPIVLLAQWLLGGAVAHVLLRLMGYANHIDQLLNIAGMTALVVGAFLIVWDWIWVALGGMDQIALGISHLAIDTWGAVLSVTFYRRNMGIPVWLGISLYLLTIAVAMPLAIMFMRSPV